MALKQATRGAQPVMSAEFDFSFNDTMKDTAGALKTFGSVYTDAGVFEVINLPSGAVVIGGDLIVEEQGVGPTAYTAAVGTSGSAAAFLAATTLLSAAGTRVALTGLGLAAVDGKNVRVTIASTVANATAGKFRLRLEYVIDGRICEVNPN